jgi:hypothetical protein
MPKLWVFLRLCRDVQLHPTPLNQLAYTCPEYLRLPYSRLVTHIDMAQSSKSKSKSKENQSTQHRASAKRTQPAAESTRAPLGPRNSDDSNPTARSESATDKIARLEGAWQNF